MTQQLPSMMLGTSAAIHSVMKSLELVAPTEIAVLLTGETGVGKEIAAAMLHRMSRRRGALVAVNGCTTSDSMFEASFFGHEAGAFTGAIGRREGYLAEANGGTLFLDEVCSLPLNSQSKLLRAIETRRFRRLGAQSDSTSHFRVVSASNRSLAVEAETGQFRLDLLHRLRGFEIRLPPLRERREDIPLLFQYFLRHFASDVSSHVSVERSAIDALMDHPWPGNVRELRHVAQLAVLFSAGTARVTCDHLRLESTSKLVSASFGSAKAPEIALLRSVLERHAWDTRLAASELQVSRKTIYERMRRLGIATKRARGSSRYARSDSTEPAPR